MKLLKLIAEDFDNINVSCKATGQYQKICDCPIYRAAKRAGLDVYYVSSHWITLNEGRSINLNGSLDNVERCRKSLLNGSKYAVIKIEL